MLSVLQSVGSPSEGHSEPGLGQTRASSTTQRPGFPQEWQEPNHLSNYADIPSLPKLGAGVRRCSWELEPDTPRLDLGLKH